jgi:peptidoglycan/xylan/chitin deacetylase (PgdA/CDA1 family)
MPAVTTAGRRGPRPSDFVVAAACSLAVLLFGSPDRGAGHSVSSSADGAPSLQTDALHPRSTSAVDAHVVDADGVQRRVAAADGLALTFDDGPDPRWTPTVLDLLRRHRAKATFCVVGQHVASHPDLVRRIADEGHALCDHTWTHDEALASRPTATVRAELRRTYDAIVAATGGRAPVYFRAPAGRWSPRVVAEAQRLGLKPLGWSLDPADWREPRPAAITRQILHGATSGAIVLLHDGYGHRAATVAALEPILSALADRRLSLVTP